MPTVTLIAPRAEVAVALISPAWRRNSLVRARRASYSAMSCSACCWKILTVRPFSSRRHPGGWSQHARVSVPGAPHTGLLNQQVRWALGRRFRFFLRHRSGLRGRLLARHRHRRRPQLAASAERRLRPGLRAGHAPSPGDQRVLVGFGPVLVVEPGRLLSRVPAGGALGLVLVPAAPPGQPQRRPRRRRAPG